MKQRLANHKRASIARKNGGASSGIEWRRNRQGIDGKEGRMMAVQKRQGSTPVVMHTMGGGLNGDGRMFGSIAR